MSICEVVLEAFEAAGAADGVAYVTLPITSGRREFALLRALGCTRDELRTAFRDRWLADVVEPNEADARRYADQARITFVGHLVVDPSRLHVTDWSQDDFDKLWTTLIERYARVIVVTPDWAFSRGARLEVALGLSLGLPMADPLGNVLTKSDLAAMSEEVESELAANGWAPDTLAGLLPDVLPLGAGPGSADPPPHFDPAAAQVFTWLVAERRYQVRKFGTDLDDEHTRQGLDERGWWWRQLTNYFGRANVLGLEHPAGRQALAKFTATACGLLESAVRVHGDLPEPGVPSGELRTADPGRAGS